MFLCYDAEHGAFALLLAYFFDYLANVLSLQQKPNFTVCPAGVYHSML